MTRVRLALWHLASNALAAALALAPLGSPRVRAWVRRRRRGAALNTKYHPNRNR